MAGAGPKASRGEEGAYAVGDVLGAIGINAAALFAGPLAPFVWAGYGLAREANREVDAGMPLNPAAIAASGAISAIPGTAAIKVPFGVAGRIGTGLAAGYASDLANRGVQQLGDTGRIRPDQLDYTPGLGTVMGGVAGAASPLLKYYMQARQKQILAGQAVALSAEDFNHALQQIETEARSLGYNPFVGKTVQEIENMFLAKGFHVSEKYPGAALKGEGGYINPKTGRSYHIDPRDFGRYREAPHVDVNYLRKYRGVLQKTKRRYFGVLEDKQ